MILHSLSIEGFRNYEQENITFGPNTNIIIGENGQGKTNLLEAIYYLTGARSFRTRFDRELIGFNKEFSHIQGNIFSEEREQTIAIRLKRGRKKEILLNGVKEGNSAALSGKLLATLFSPEDLSLVRDGASSRRRLMDLAISQIRPKYALWLSEFNRLYLHKTRILKDRRDKPALLDMLDDFNIHLAKAGAQLIYYRAAFVKKLNEAASVVHRDCSGERETLSLIYETVKTVSDPSAKPAEIFIQLMEHQNRLRQAELDAELCLSGAHKDDISITIGDQPARAFASQGQVRTAALAIKLAERDILFQDRGEYPLLLLDDVLSELDATRQNFVLNRIQGGQVFITCCEDNKIAQRTGGRIFTVAKGEVV
ncbi:MAG: DNA replication/repair protein RecF [Oscillospiraceae bacterium]|nr:DNA replication/repair protein RecF [Oscillospiraceae bacterium]